MSLLDFLFKKKEDPFTKFEIIIDTPLKNRPEPRTIPKAEAENESYDIDHHGTRVVGVLKENEDGINRQEIIKNCKRGEKLMLVPNPNDPREKYSVRVCRSTGEQIGFLTPRMGKVVMDNSLVGYKSVGYIAEVTGGKTPDSLLGANIFVVFAHQDTPEAELWDYAESLNP